MGCTFRDMWKEFDKGLHLFLKHFIFLPVTSEKTFFRVLLGTFLSFFTVYYWHGATDTCLHWALCNFIGVTAEVLVFKFVKLTFLPTALRSRIFIFIQSILFGFLICSNLIFLFQSQATWEIIFRLYFEKIYFTLYAHMVLYSGVISISYLFTAEKTEVREKTD